jgi:prevent-host-death family protein
VKVLNDHVRTWSLQDAKARLSEVIRLAQTEGPQLVTVHGKATVRVEAVQPMARKKIVTGKDLFEALRGEGPFFDWELEPRPLNTPSREFSFDPE